MLAWQIATESSRRAMSALACLPMHLRSLWATLSITDRIAALLLAASSTIFYFLNLSWGMPHNQYGDEWAIINSTLMLPYRLGDPRLYFYGVPYMYVYAVVIGVVFAVQFLFGLVSGPTDFAVAFLRDPTAVVLTGRLISALCGVGVALLSYALARRFLPAAWAFVVAAAAAWTEVAVRMAHYAKTDQFFALLYLAVVWLALSAQRSRRRALAALLLAGVSVACKLPAVALGPVLVVMLFFDLRTEQKSSWRAALSHPLFWLSPLLCAVGFFLVNPWAMIRLPSLIAQIFTVESMYGVEGSHAGPFDSSLYYLNLLWKNVGPVGLVLSLFSLTLPFVLRERRRDAAILAAAVWPFLLLVCATRHHDFHWLLPVTSLLLIGGAVALHHLVAQTATRWRRAFTIAAGFAGVALLLQTGYMGIRTAWLFGLPSTKDQAREWVEVNVPAGTAIALDTGRYLPSGTLHLRQDPQRLAEMIDMEKGPGHRGGRRRYSRTLPAYARPCQRRVANLPPLPDPTRCAVEDSQYPRAQHAAVAGRVPRIGRTVHHRFGLLLPQVLQICRPVGRVPRLRSQLSRLLPRYASHPSGCGSLRPGARRKSRSNHHRLSAWIMNREYLALGSSRYATFVAKEPIAGEGSHALKTEGGKTNLARRVPGLFVGGLRLRPPAGPRLFILILLPVS